VDALQAGEKGGRAMKQSEEKHMWRMYMGRRAIVCSAEISYSTPWSPAIFELRLNSEKMDLR